MASEVTIKVNAEVDPDAKWLLNRQERMEKQRLEFIGDLFKDMKDYLAYQEGYEAGKRDAASPWLRVEEPPKDGQECVVAFLGQTDWIYEHATYYSDLNQALEEDIFIEGTDGFIVDGNVGYARHGLFKYWMPIEPPKEDA